MSMMESSTPATEALLRLLKQQEFESSSNQEAQRVNTPGSLEKRPRLHVLDMTSLLEASEQIEGCHAFPAIQWPTMDSNKVTPRHRTSDREAAKWKPLFAMKPRSNSFS